MRATYHLAFLAVAVIVLFAAVADSATPTRKPPTKRAASPRLPSPSRKPPTKKPATLTKKPATRTKKPSTPTKKRLITATKKRPVPTFRVSGFPIPQSIIPSLACYTNIGGTQIFFNVVRTGVSYAFPPGAYSILVKDADAPGGKSAFMTSVRWISPYQLSGVTPKPPGYIPGVPLTYFTERVTYSIVHTASSKSVDPIVFGFYTNCALFGGCSQCVISTSLS
eukprot:CAMPEP_0184644316 /NCGR_PEP_ID=MMETSP0308-20130426/1054_1 /TAXON_ID=38269 /ORGANISM="Gloeochaete witrockiana, Strain SAG 46.84" /LENGTH=222 /DNA_ID=CAMNT_0027072775 /DNA_START=160 /DNA_END=828 /DNA_ORIENTATION=+